MIKNFSVRIYSLENEIDNRIQSTVTSGYHRVSGGFTLTWYAYMCLPFGGLFRKIWYSDRRGFIRDKGAQINRVYFGQIIVKAHNLIKIGCFSFENGILIGGKLDKKLV